MDPYKNYRAVSINWGSLLWCPYNESPVYYLGSMLGPAPQGSMTIPKNGKR